MPFWQRFFGVEPVLRDSLARADAAMAVEGLDIHGAITAHRQWKQQLRDHLLAPGETPAEAAAALKRDLVCRDDGCELGCWIHGKGRARLGTFPGFTALQAHHRMFHHVAANVLALAAANQHADARRMLEDQFEDYSGRVTDDLLLLQRVVDEAVAGR